ncbi:MAG: DUF2298 domain-containing protein [Halodesulfurarchaeum sp.]
MEIGLILGWLALYLGLGALALPVASWVFAGFTDSGAGLAIPVAFAVLAFSSYWIGQFRFGPLTAVLGVGILAFLAFLAVRSGVSMDRRRYRDAAVVFTLFYLLLILIRLYRPSAVPGGGEKFLDFGLLASLLRSPVLPPEDMWFAGKPVNYYYGGHMLAAVFAMLTDTAPRFAYNTALAGYYAAYSTAAWGLAGALTARAGRSYRLGGALGAFFVGLASNLSTPIRFLAWVLPEPAGRRLTGLFGLEFTGLATGPMDFNYWYASRVIDATTDPNGWKLITEFPFFAFLNGDLHAHMMSPVFLLLGAALTAAVWQRPASDRRGRISRLLLLVPIGGLLLITNTWSAPTVFGLAWLSLLFAPAAPWTLLPAPLRERIDSWAAGGSLRTEASRVTVAALIAASLAVLGALSVYPFLLGTVSARSIGFLPTPRSGLGGLLTVHGVFLAVTGGYLATRVTRRTVAIVGLVMVGVTLLTSLVRATAIGLFLPPLLGGWYLLRTRADLGFETALAVGALGLTLLVEFVFVVERAGPGRMNTVFKVGAQVWALWSVAAGVMLARLLGPAGPIAGVKSALRTLRERPLDAVAGTGGADGGGGAAGASKSKTAAPLSTQVTSVLLVLTVLGLSIYPAFGVAWAVGGGIENPTLNAHHYIKTDHPKERSAIRWVANRSGQPTLVSAPGTEIYRWVNAPSSMTGVPTVVGWIHEVAYRGSDPYWRRVRDVRTIFETRNATLRAELLETYSVEYIYVGPIERARYDTVAYGTEPGISIAYSDQYVTIYRVEF